MDTTKTNELAQKSRNARRSSMAIQVRASLAALEAATVKLAQQNERQSARIVRLAGRIREY